MAEFLHILEPGEMVVVEGNKNERFIFILLRRNYRMSRS